MTLVYQLLDPVFVSGVLGVAVWFAVGIAWFAAVGLAPPGGRTGGSVFAEKLWISPPLGVSSWAMACRSEP